MGNFNTTSPAGEPMGAEHCQGNAGNAVPCLMQIEVRHPGLRLNNIPPKLFCMSWCLDFEFRVTHRGLRSYAT